MRMDAARALGLKGKKKTITFGTFDGQDPAITTQLVDFELVSTLGDRVFSVSSAYVVPQLNIGRRRSDVSQSQFESQFESQCGYLRDLQFAARRA